MAQIIISLIRWIFWKIRYGKHFRVNLFDGIYLNHTVIKMPSNTRAKLIFDGRVGCRRVQFNINGDGQLEIGDHVFINDGVIINARSNIKIGNGTLIGQNVLMYDHDHDFRSIDTLRDDFLLDNISIGENVWIGSGVIILRGSTIGDGAVIGAGVVVKGQIPPGTLIISKQDLITKKLER